MTATRRNGSWALIWETGNAKALLTSCGCVGTGLARHGGRKEMAERLGIPVRSVSMEEIQSMELSPTEGMGMSMG